MPLSGGAFPLPDRDRETRPNLLTWCDTPGYVLPMTKTSTAAATLTADQDAALRAMADRIVDFLEAGIERFGDADRFMAAMTAYNAQAGR